MTDYTKRPFLYIGGDFIDAEKILVKYDGRDNGTPFRFHLGGQASLSVNLEVLDKIIYEATAARSQYFDEEWNNAAAPLQETTDPDNEFPDIPPHGDDDAPVDGEA
jgi:hypothetical protein